MRTPVIYWQPQTDYRTDTSKAIYSHFECISLKNDVVYPWLWFSPNHDMHPCEKRSVFKSYYKYQLSYQLASVLMSKWPWSWFSAFFTQVQYSLLHSLLNPKIPAHFCIRLSLLPFTQYIRNWTTKWFCREFYSRVLDNAVRKYRSMCSSNNVLFREPALLTSKYAKEDGNS